MFKSKTMRAIGAVAVLLLAVIMMASCATPAPASVAPPASETSRTPASVLAVPGVVTPKAAIEYIGANFVPGEQVTVVLLMDLNPGKTAPLENAVAAGADGFKVDGSGAFYIKAGTAPEAPGAYGVRVYDSKGKIVASTVFLVKAPPPPPTPAPVAK